MNKYNTLLEIFDDIRINAESNVDLFLPENGKTDLVNARSRALIHFFLKSRFGILDFKSRESLITDGGQDGGLDAYFIDNKEKIIYLIQSKFRVNAKNFEKTHVENKDLWKMDLDRITRGEKKDVDNNNYNRQILNFQKNLRKCKTSEFKYKVVIVANLNDLQKKYIITNHFPKKWNIEIFDYTRMYNELLFSYVKNDFFKENKINLKIISSGDKDPIRYKVKTEYGTCEILMLFIPTEEIAKVLLNYKNSILKHNPRTYLGMKRNGVNARIEDSILNKNTNDFVLLNNGITILSTESSHNGNIGRVGFGEITIENPQIINGGQTSFVLSDIYERFIKGKFKKNPFEGKEVLLKVIIQADHKKYDKITSSVSLATNSQSSISKGDLLSNHFSQVDLQKYIFEQFGLLYERKKGEFFDILDKKHIKNESVIDRVTFIRIAYSSYFPDIAKNPKNMSESIIFSDNIFKIIEEKNNYDKYVLAYQTYLEVCNLKKQARKPQNKWFFDKCGNALRYGDIAVTMITVNNFKNTRYTKSQILAGVNDILNKWKEFENYAFSKDENFNYFNKTSKEYNPTAYYKSDNLIKDLKAYFNDVI